MTIAFTISAAALPRLAALRYATALSTRSALAHIHVSVDGDAARFVATDGRLLASLTLDVGDVDGESLDAVLDGPLFVAACTTLLRADHTTRVRLIIDRSAGEVRLIRGMAVAVVRLLDIVHPVTRSFLDRYRNQGLVPAIASFAPALLTAAQRISGVKKTAMLFWSPCPEGKVARCWSRDANAEASLSTAIIADLLAQPGIWTDRELLVLIMPVARVCTGAPDLSPFISPLLPNQSTPVLSIEMASSAA